jgi:hypothetical protein
MVTLEKRLDKQLIERRITATLDCVELQQIDARQSLYDCLPIKQFIQALPFQSPPALYWFTILSNHSADTILTAIDEGRKSGDRKFPHVPAQTNPTNTLYVGQVTKDLRGRMISHLGYNGRLHNHGLQLCHWAQRIGLKLRLDCLIMLPAAKDQILIWESELAKSLHPLLGKY